MDRLFEPVCNPGQVKDCEGKTLRHLCKTCDKSPDKRQSPPDYVLALWNIHLLQLAGLQFAGNDFDLQFWMDLAQLKQRIQARSSIF